MIISFILSSTARVGSPPHDNEFNLVGLRMYRGIDVVMLYTLDLTFKFSAPFLKTFSEHQEALEECLGKIEEIASAMDTVKRNVSIVSVSTGTVGIAGGVLCIIGLVLTPVTLGVSSILSIVGTAVGAGAGPIDETVGLRGTGTGALKIMGGVGSSVFIVWDLYRICTNSISLAKGKKNETAEIIRRTVAELRRELQSYKHLYEVLQKGKEDAINN
uniref:Uncharacterized protein n=1 Tax=Erpetoichthys calabaricus TaxID=27687 RepID=A0A8C4SAU8_ERPCA